MALVSYRELEKDYTQEVHKFDNGYGASVIRGPHTYGGKDGLYELAVLRWTGEGGYYISYSSPITKDVIGYLTHEEVDFILDDIERLPPPDEGD